MVKGQQEEELTFLKQQLLVGSLEHGVLLHMKRSANNSMCSVHTFEVQTPWGVEQ